MDTGQSKLTLEVVVKHRREALGLTQRELARRVGKSASHVSAVEAGRMVPHFRSFARLARELRLTGPELESLLSVEADR